MPIMANTVYLGWETLDDIKARLRSRALGELFAHWVDIRQSDVMPPRDLVDPTVMPRSLPYIWLGDAGAQCSTFTYRLAGEAVNRMHGINLKGRTIAEVVPASRRRLICERFDCAVSTPAVMYNFGQIYAELNHMYCGERLILPLGRPDGTVTHLIGATYWVWGDQGLDMPAGATESYFSVGAALAAETQALDARA